MPDAVKCAVYARYSTNNQREASIEDQIRKCRDAASSKQWEILDSHIYFDKAQSGTRSHTRESFKEMMKVSMSADCPFQKILVDDTSRIARNTQDALNIFSLLTFYGVHVYYVSQNIDTSHETAEEMITINGLIDSLYIRNLAKETHRGMEGQVLKGYSGGSRRYGYRSEPVFNGKVDIYGNPDADGYILKILPDEADTVIRIFSMFGEQGYSARKIVNILNSELIETGSPNPPRGKYWCVSSLLGSKKSFRGILNNEIYIGRYYWNRLSSKRNPENGQRKVFLKNSSKWIVSSRPELQIISPDLWQKVKGRQKFIQQKTSGKYTKGNSLYTSNVLTGLLKCSECGGNIVVVSGGKHSKMCGCSSNWNKGEAVCSNQYKLSKIDIEDKVFKSLPLNMDTDDVVPVLLDKVNSIIKETSDRLHPGWRDSALIEQLKRVDKEISNFINAIRAGFISNIVKHQLNEAERRRDGMQKSLETSQDKPQHIYELSPAQIKDYLTDFHRTINLHPVLGKIFLSHFVEKVVVIPEKGTWLFKVYLRLKNPPNDSNVSGPVPITENMTV